MSVPIIPILFDVKLFLLITPSLEPFTTLMIRDILF